MKKDRIHLKAPGNWINDPNGFIYYKGQYHLFYQYFPYAPQWGTMHWGHAVSSDLTEWEHKGVALFPTRYEDQNGCFSGSAVEHEGKMYLYYTGIHYDETDRENIHKCPGDKYQATQMMITSPDGFSFDNFSGKKVIIPAFMEGEKGDRTHTRDPKVWRGKDAWYMVLGTTDQEKQGKILFYKSQDLENWIFVNQAGKEERGWMWECPDLFEVQGQTILMLSPMGILQEENKEANHAVCMVVEFQEKDCSVGFPDTYQFLDYGLDLYASQSTLDEEGHRVVTGWIRMPEAVDGKWRGMFCIPRVAEVKKGHIYFHPHPNIEKRFTKKITSPAQAHEAGYRLTLELKEGESLDIGGYLISRRNNCICTDRTRVFREHRGWRQTAVSPEVKEGDLLEIYVDKNLIEVFINRGEYVISSTVYDLGNKITADKEGEIKKDTLE